jgi:hypothetical protein
MELDRASGHPCVPLRAPRVLALHKGDEVGVRGAVNVVGIFGSARSATLALGLRFPNVAPDHTLVAVAGPLVIRIAPASRPGRVQVCVPVTEGAVSAG